MFCLCQVSSPPVAGPLLFSPSFSILSCNHAAYFRLNSANSQHRQRAGLACSTAPGHPLRRRSKAVSHQGPALPPCPHPPLPHIVMFLDVNLVEHHILLFGVDVCFHLHGNMTGKDRQQETLLQREASESVTIPSTSLLSPLSSIPIPLPTGPGKTPPPGSP